MNEDINKIASVIRREKNIRFIRDTYPYFLNLLDEKDSSYEVIETIDKLLEKSQLEKLLGTLSISSVETLLIYDSIGVLNHYEELKETGFFSNNGCIDLSKNDWSISFSFWQDRTKIIPDKLEKKCDVLFIIPFESFDWRMFFSNYEVYGAVAKKSISGGIFQSKKTLKVAKKIIERDDNLIVIHPYGLILFSDSKLDQMVSLACNYQVGLTNHKLY